MKKWWFLALAIMIGSLAGCSGKTDVEEILTPDRIYEKALIYTRENQLVRELETKAAITATLLNELFPDRYNDDDGLYFFVGIVTELAMVDFKKNYHLLLNGQPPLEIKKIDPADDLYKLMPNVNRWGKYYLVKYPPTTAKKLLMAFEVYPYGKVLLRFQRPAKRR